MSDDFAPSIGDNYPDYLDDEAGYLYHAWEVTSIGEAARHDRWLLAPLDDELPLSELQSDLERWALARRCLQLQRPDDFLTICEAILTGERHHPALNYGEIALQRAAALARAARLPDALAVIDVDAGAPHPLPLSSARAKAWLTLLAGHPEDADRLYQDALGVAPEASPGDTLFEIAEDFVRAGAIAQARAWIERTAEHLHAHNDRLTAVDLELLREELRALETTTPDPAP
ncbi:hypothetical protein FRC96_20360 [Lujinxingia vulgaris]|uniref:Tetratricopeptide repeat protein n=1 Tax=Lujinxingia vulgaris TaxID=2600176 RepID=A0A5C6WXH4_9DELT|nr:hypothetical protein [Lujinxingia vulgaris]TXD31664.1 hypothetical protein FRC96_20360 [Lujinxingia vulgaris]